MKSGLNVLGIFLLAATLMLAALGLCFNYPGHEERRLAYQLHQLYQDYSYHSEEIKVMEQEQQPITNQRLIFRILSWIGAGVMCVFTLLSFTLARFMKSDSTPHSFPPTSDTQNR
jgi:hypothetical protein